MSKVPSIIELHPWLQTPGGAALLAWEQEMLDELVADVFGFHALQLGMPELQGLQANRMPHRWLALDAAYEGWPPEHDTQATRQEAPLAVALRCDFESLPFPTASLDLVVLPHALELARDPHHTLREVERVLMPEGRVVILGFNPTSLWGLSHRMDRWRAAWWAHRGTGGAYPALLPEREFIAYWRLRDWLRLLDLEVLSSTFGAYRPLLRSARRLERLVWMEGVGSRWWPVLGSAYCLVAVKRTCGMRLVGKVRKTRKVPTAAPAVVSRRQCVPRGHNERDFHKELMDE